MIGDRILADVIMGNKHGFLTVKTEPFDTSTENLPVKISRWFENSILPKLSKSPPPFESFEALKAKGEYKEVDKRIS